MAEYDVPVFAIQQRSSWGYLSRRDAIVTGGDDFTLTLTIYADEDAETPVSTQGAWALLSLYDLGHSGLWNWWGSVRWDYGLGVWGGRTPPRPVLQLYNAPVYFPDLGQLPFDFTPETTQNISGRFGFIIEYEGTSAGASVVRGVMEIRPGLAFPPRNGFVLDDGTGDGSYLEGPDVLAP